MELPKRKTTRLKIWDYSKNGAYFITICTAEKRCILSTILPVGEGLAPPETKLSALGEIVREEILNLPVRYPSISLDRYVIMPNHVHLLVTLSEHDISESPTVMDLVRVMKSISARRCSQAFGVKPLWQRSFHEHIVRNENDYREIWKYIEANPAKWSEDRYSPK